MYEKWAEKKQPTRQAPPMLHLTRSACWLAGCVAGLVTATLTPSAQRRRTLQEYWKGQWQSWVGRMLSPQAGPGGVDLPAGPSLEPLRQTLLGKTKGDVVAALGPPPATSNQPPPQKPSAYWHADVWYYPLDRRRRAGLAINFAGGHVASIDPISGPQ